MATKEELLKELSDCVLDLCDDEVEEVAQSYIDAGFEAENEGESNIRFDGLALLVFLRGVGLHGEDVVLVFRAVR